MIYCCQYLWCFVCSHCVHILDWFDFDGHICIVFDKLGHSVYEFLVLIFVLCLIKLGIFVVLTCIQQTCRPYRFWWNSPAFQTYSCRPGVDAVFMKSRLYRIIKISTFLLIKSLIHGLVDSTGGAYDAPPYLLVGWLVRGIPSIPAPSPHPDARGHPWRI